MPICAKSWGKQPKASFTSALEPIWLVSPHVMHILDAMCLAPYLNPTGPGGLDAARCYCVLIKL